MGRACVAYEGEDILTGFWRGNLKERDHLDERYIWGTLKWMFDVYLTVHHLDT
jgi:hypothetical protein